MSSFAIFVCCWKQGKLPQDFRDAIIIALYKNKGDNSDSSNYLGITLLPNAGKALARILINWLVSTITEENVLESQCGLRANRVTKDMVFILIQLQEKYQELNKGLNAAFADLTKRSISVKRTGI